VKFCARRGQLARITGIFVNRSYIGSLLACRMSCIVAVRIRETPTVPRLSEGCRLSDLASYRSICSCHGSHQCFQDGRSGFVYPADVVPLATRPPTLLDERSTTSTSAFRFAAARLQGEQSITPAGMQKVFLLAAAAYAVLAGNEGIGIGLYRKLRRIKNDARKPFLIMMSRRALPSGPEARTDPEIVLETSRSRL